MAIDLSSLLSEKINSLNNQQSKTVTCKDEPSKSSGNSLFASLLSPNNQTTCKQFKQLTSYARLICDNIVDIKKFLVENRCDYLDMYSSLFISKLTDEDRNQIDEDVQEGITDCQAKIAILKRQVNEKGSKLGFQRHAAISAIVESVELYLKMVCDMFAELRAFRMRRSFDKRRLARLDRDYNFDSEPYLNSRPVSIRQLVDNFSNGEDNNIDDFHPTMNKEDENLNENNHENHAIPFSNFSQDEFSLYENNPDESRLTRDEIQIIEEENSKLLQEFSSMVGETRQVEKSIVQIAKLNRTFQENFLVQDENINRVQTTALQTTSNIKDGNEELRGAIRNKGRFTVWIIFFNLVLTFSLIFLDWYNP